MYKNIVVIFRHGMTESTHRGIFMRFAQLFLLFMLLFQALLATGCAKPPRDTTPEFVDARELKLKVRELADQMLATTDNSLLTGIVALPTSFVDLNNKAQTSSLGNFLGESLIYEFNQRAFPVREYRLTGDIKATVDQGDLALLRKGLVPANQKWAALVVGTYYRDQDAIFVNARLVRAYDGMVLRSGQLVLAMSPLLHRMSAHTIPPKNKPSLHLPSGTVAIKPAPSSWGKPAVKPGPGLYGYEY